MVLLYSYSEVSGRSIAAATARLRVDEDATETQASRARVVQGATLRTRSLNRLDSESERVAPRRIYGQIARRTE